MQTVHTTTSSASVAAHFQSSQGVCALTYDPLDVDLIIKSVGDDGAGATAVFIGTTRNSFKGGCYNRDITSHSNCPSGKVVTRLEYQAYRLVNVAQVRS